MISFLTLYYIYFLAKTLKIEKALEGVGIFQEDNSIILVKINNILSVGFISEKGSSLCFELLRTGLNEFSWYVHSLTENGAMKPYSIKMPRKDEVHSQGERHS